MSNNDNKYRDFFENSSDAMLIIENGNFVDCNAATVTMLGYDSKMDIVNTPPHMLSPEVQPDGTLSADKAPEMMRIATQQGTHRFEWDHIKKDGTIIPLEVSLTAINNGELQLHTVWRDISSHRKAEKTLKESEERFRALHDASFGGVLIHDNGLILDCNQGLSDMTGFTNEELIGMDGLKLFAPDHLDIVLHNMNRGHAERYEVEGVRKDGSIYPLSIKGKNINYKGKEVRVIEFQDVTKEKQAEKVLRESEERFRHTFETNPDPVILARLDDGGIIDVNRAFEEVTGISKKAALGKNSVELELWEDKSLRGSFREQLQTSGEVTNFEAEFRVRGGRSKIGLLSARIINSNDTLCMLIAIRDITNEKAAERALAEMDQMKSDFISTAAHEIRTPLTAIMGFTELLLDPLSAKSLDEEMKHRYLNEIFDRCTTLNRMIKDFLDVSRIQSGLPISMDFQETDFADVLRKITSYYQLHEMGHSFELVLPPEPCNPSITIDRHRINQVLENILSNAVKYSPQGGQVILRGEIVPEGWKVSLKDDGLGMTPEQLSRVFDKFYRADAKNAKTEGLGLGMSIVKYVVEAHGGNINVTSTQGKGTTVFFYLPYLREAKEAGTLPGSTKFS